MSANTTFGTQLIGQTEKALNAILDRQLAGTGVTEPQWVGLTLAVMSGGELAHDQMVDRIAGALKHGAADAAERIAELSAAGLLEVSEDGQAPVTVTDAGARLHAQIRGAATEITARLWGDLPADDLDAAGRVLATVLDRANAELAQS